MRKWECGIRKAKAESIELNAEVGMRNGKEWERWNRKEWGSRTRRRPIGRDYAAAKDAEGGMRKTDLI